METKEKIVITVENIVNAPLQKVWDYWNKPEHITQWNHASDDWHSPWAKSDFREGGNFSSRMEAKDGSMGFDFGGIYDVIRDQEYLEYTMGDGRKVKVSFKKTGTGVHVSESFDTENTHPIELQRGGWQAILDNFKKYTEGK